MKIEEKDEKIIITDFNELEIYKIAVKIEQDGINFYKSLSEKTVDTELKNKLEFLLEQEKKHLEFFSQQKDIISQNIEDTFEEDDLLNYIDYGIFQPYKSIEELPEKIDDLKKILKLGIIIEEKSIKFYTACREKISSLETKDELLKIIEEEQRHITVLKEAFS